MNDLWEQLKKRAQETDGWSVLEVFCEDGLPPPRRYKNNDGTIEVLIPDNLRLIAKENGFFIVAANYERNSYLMKKIKT